MRPQIAEFEGMVDRTGESPTALQLQFRPRVDVRYHSSYLL